MSYLAAVISVFLILICCLGGNAYASNGQMSPHAPRTEGPWFEGWYTRITDPVNRISFAVVGASSIKDQDALKPRKKLDGYLAVLFSRGGTNPTSVAEAFPNDTMLLVDGKPLGLAREDTTTSGQLQLPLPESDFEWVAPELGRITKDELHVVLPGKAEVHAVFRSRLPWPDQLGPEGLASLLKFLPLHWYVHSLGSETAYRIRFKDAQGEQVFAGNGYAHQEKNWGLAFPSAWIWSQAVSEDNSAQFAFTGGKLVLGGVPMTKWILGYRSRAYDLSFSPARLDLKYDIEHDTCKGSFKMAASSGGRTLVVSASAPLSTFGKVSIPRRDGFAIGAVESFSTTIRVDVYEQGRNHGRWNQPSETRIFRNAALEFGADFMRCGR